MLALGAFLVLQAYAIQAFAKKALGNEDYKCFVNYILAATAVLVSTLAVIGTLTGCAPCLYLCSFCLFAVLVFPSTLSHTMDVLRARQDNSIRLSGACVAE